MDRTSGGCGFKDNKSRKELRVSTATSYPKKYYIDRESLWWAVLTVIVAVSIASRAPSLEKPQYVCWDETHFGKFASYYINRTFFFDVHPPLGKMLLGLAGQLSGYNGTFAFSKPGDTYNDTSQYLGMRTFSACVGSLLVPMTYVIVWDLTESIGAGILAATLTLTDVGNLALSRFILLDPIMLFFIFGATLCDVHFRKQTNPFSISWWFWLVITGIFLSFAVSVKFVGIFVVTLVGLSTIQDLWNLLGNLSLTLFDIFKHFAARALCLIVLPCVSYILIFLVHLHVLKYSGPGDSHFSSGFQATLVHNVLHNVSLPEFSAYGSVVTIRSLNPGKGYLHSHRDLYPKEVSPRQQQITTYSHKDYNNEWIFKYEDKEVDQNIPLQYVKHGDLVRLEHKSTRRNLHSHRVESPVTKSQFQMTGYGNEGEGDENDIFKVLIVNGNDKEHRLMTVRSQFRLMHVNLGCYVEARKSNLPKWGHDQGEVTCNSDIRSKHTLWNIETVQDVRQHNVSFNVYRPGFLSRFIESHIVMFTGNSGLVPKEGEETSRPWMWPFTYQGQLFARKDNTHILLLGNPITWWSIIAISSLFLMVFIVVSVKEQRNSASLRNLSHHEEFLLTRNTFNGCYYLFLGWFLHYAPFWAMGRILYFHHYFPAAIFSFMFTAVFLDYCFQQISNYLPREHQQRIYVSLLFMAITICCYSFYLFSPLSYGFAGPLSNNETSAMHNLHWLDSWIF